MRIDAHHHFWHYTPAEYDWIDDAMASIRRDFLPADLAPEIAAANIDVVISVQARQTLAETEALLAWANNHPWIAGVVGWLPLIDPAIGDLLDRFAANPGLKGVRHVLQAELSIDSRLVRKAAEKPGLVVVARQTRTSAEPNIGSELEPLGTAHPLAYPKRLSQSIAAPKRGRGWDWRFSPSPASTASLPCASSCSRPFPTAASFIASVRATPRRRRVRCLASRRSRSQLWSSLPPLPGQRLARRLGSSDPDLAGGPGAGEIDLMVSDHEPPAVGRA